jgi:hypothetical protein
MDEKQLEIIFKEFLLTKGYESDNLLSQVTLKTGEGGSFHPDLVIIDLENKAYIALVEFKNRIDGLIKTNALGQFYKYFSLLGTPIIPAFLVFPISEEDFQILSLSSSNTFEPITKEEFPSFETLSAKRQTDEKLKENEVELKKLKEIESKNRKSRQFSFLAILSLVIGTIAGLLSIFIVQKEITKTKNIPRDCCDSIHIVYSLLDNKLNDLEKQFKTLSIPSNKVDSSISIARIKALDLRVKIIENGIDDNPEKALSILQIRNEIKLLKKSDDFIKELTEAKLESLNERLSLISGIQFGLLITIIGSILSYAFTNLRRNKSDNDL